MLAQALIARVLQLAPRFKVAGDAPETWSELQARSVLCVSPVGCERTIYGSSEANHAFRAWHDATHLAMGADFSLAAELAVAAQQCAEVAPELRPLLWADTAGQALFFAAYCRFPECQVSFVRDYLRTGTV